MTCSTYPEVVVGMRKVVEEHNIVDSKELHQVEGAGLKHTLVEAVPVQEASVVDMDRM